MSRMTAPAEADIPAASRPALDVTARQLGFVPNVARTFLARVASSVRIRALPRVRQPGKVGERHGSALIRSPARPRQRSAFRAAECPTWAKTSCSATASKGGLKAANHRHSTIRKRHLDPESLAPQFVRNVLAYITFGHPN